MTGVCVESPAGTSSPNLLRTGLAAKTWSTGGSTPARTPIAEITLNPFQTRPISQGNEGQRFSTATVHWGTDGGSLAGSFVESLHTKGEGQKAPLQPWKLAFTRSVCQDIDSTSVQGLLTNPGMEMELPETCTSLEKYLDFILTSTTHSSSPSSRHTDFQAATVKQRCQYPRGLFRLQECPPSRVSFQPFCPRCE